jgi:CHASE3 domain sensor protein
VSLSLYEKVSLNFGSGVVAVALIGTLSYVSLGKLAVTTRSAGDTEAVLEQVDMLRASIADAGIAQRDYVLGGSADDRIRFENARSSASRNLERLRAISTMSAVSSARADSLAPVLVAHLDDLGRVANMRQSLGLDSAAVAMRDDSVTNLHDRVDALLAQFRDDQRLLFAARSREQAVRASDAGILLAIGLLVSFIAAALALANIRRYLADRRMLEL